MPKAVQFTAVMSSHFVQTPVLKRGDDAVAICSSAGNFITKFIMM